MLGRLMIAGMCSAFLLAGGPGRLVLAAGIDLVQVEKSVGRVICKHNEHRIASGSGFVVSSQGHFVTNHHVVAGEPNHIIVAFSPNRADWIRAKILLTSAKKDLALLKLEREGRPALPLSPANLVRKGEMTWAIGYPGAADRLPGRSEENPFQAKVVKGVVSNIAREVTGRTVIQTDAAINPGNSGGPLLNDCGQVIGVNTFGPAFAPQFAAFLKAIREGRQPGTLNPPQGISFAVSASDVIALLRSRSIAHKLAMGPCEDGEQVNALVWVAISVAVSFALLSLLVVFNVARHQSLMQSVAKAGETLGLSRLYRADKHPESAALLGLKGWFAGEEFMFDSRPIYLGKDPTKCKVAFPHDNYQISDLHAEIKYDRSLRRFVLSDLNSKAGTYLKNGKKLRPDRPATLASGDQFYLGSTEELFQVVTRRASRASAGVEPTGMVLEGLSGVFMGQEFPLGNRPVILGRNPKQASIVFPSQKGGKYISRAHAKLNYDKSSRRVMIEDLGSTYGTFIAPRQRLRPKQPRMLKPGQVFYLANRSQSFRIKQV